MPPSLVPGVPLCPQLLKKGMLTNGFNAITDFCIAGINYKKSDTSVRGCFSVNQDQYGRLLADAESQGIRQLFVLSTCNRTEIYGIADPEMLADLVCTHTQGDRQLFRELCYVKKGTDAILHLFRVSAGLDSQILGDYEIVGQIKQAVKFSKAQGCIGPFMERLANSVLQSSKSVKNNTFLSGGTVSVSFAAVQYIREHVADCAGKKYLLLGTGKIGSSTCKNLADYIGAAHITLVNRTEAKAEELARKTGLRHRPIEALPQAIEEADIILVATNAQEPTIHKEHLGNSGSKLIIDLSVPCNVAADAASLEHITLVNVDDLARIKDETLQKRMEEVPKAEAIIHHHLEEFLEWHRMRRYVPMLTSMKHTLQELSTIPASNAGPAAKTEEDIQKVINGLASRIKQEPAIGCQWIRTINDFMA